jgi:hypothetical protein
LGQGGQGTGGGIAEGTQGRQEDGQEDVNPLIGFPLHHTEQAPLDDLERIGFEGDQDEQEPIFRRRQGAVFIHDKPTSSPRLPIHPPHGHPGVERGLEGWDELLKLVKRHAREIEELQRVRLSLGKP